jgi:hypothetical protein
VKTLGGDNGLDNGVPGGGGGPGDLLGEGVEGYGEEGFSDGEDGLDVGSPTEGGVSGEETSPPRFGPGDPLRGGGFQDNVVVN